MNKLIAIASVAGLAVAGSSQTIDPFFASNYSYIDLGSAQNVPTNYGGLTFKLGDPSKLLLGGAANGAAGQIYEVDVVRDGTGHVVGLGSTAVFAEAPYNDGGVTYGPGGVLFASRWPVNEVAQYKIGSVVPDKIIDLAALGVANSHSALMFGPSGRSYSGRLKLSSWSGGQFYDATYAPDGLGTFDITGVTQTATLQGGPEGYVYVPLGSALFGDSMLVSEYSAGLVSTYDVDVNGDPIIASRRLFMTGLSGAEGAAIDPVTGDFLFSTFGGGNRVIAVRGFAVPEPGTLAVVGLGFVALLKRRRR